MPAQKQDPIFQRERLRDRLRKAREGANITQREVAEALDWSPSKIIRIENGSVGVSITDLRALLSHYGVADPEQVQELTSMARAAKQPPWWAPYRGVAKPEYLTYISYETSASVIRNFETNLVPGLLQTEEYAREVIGDADPLLLDLRLERQDRLMNSEGPEAFFILDETAVRRVVGNEKIMRHQLEKLLTANELPNVKIMVVPFTAGIYPQFRSPYVIFEFTDSSDELVAYLENPDGQVVFSEKNPGYAGPKKPSDYLDAFWTVEKSIALEVSDELLFPGGRE
ncbi:helix-turn-helix transcriptional regulator [Streptomyces sp. TRM 70361]|uniref:helix-turn-helix domain-containing protein n=1 Tax=Streptomyces sp. TRM 70361 TaxID=3116553 RepID=UPI002E7C401A|nr:helix-turn-helix transcriptional regulator [Streptomyces sp. TRM 70361]MEE1939381.1 helix-turn-helix transcriptional regulator [Streptomyces sp. TRM 70361]